MEQLETAFFFCFVVVLSHSLAVDSEAVYTCVVLVPVIGEHLELDEPEGFVLSLN